MDALPTLPAGAREDGTRKMLLRLWRDYVSQQKLSIAIVAVLTLALSGSTALYPIVINYAIQLFTNRDPNILITVPVLIIGVTIIKSLAQYLQVVQVNKVVLIVVRDLQCRLFLHLARADMARLEREAPAQLATRFTTDAGTIREALARAVNGVADACTIVGLVGSMLYLDWLLCVIAGALYPLAAVPIQRIGKRARRASGGMQEQMADVSVFLNESFAQARTVRAYRLEQQEIARADTAFMRLYRALLRMTRNRARVEPILEVLGGVAVAAVIGFEGWRATVNDQTLGNFTGFIAALLLASRPLRALGSLNAAVQEGLAGMSRVFAVLDERPRIVDAPGAVPLPDGNGHIVMEHVRFVYPDGRIGLEDLTLEVEAGRTIALVGPSGGGKSTALSLIPRLHDAAGGTVTIDGADVRSVTVTSLRDAIAYVGQDTLLFDDTILANIRMGRPGATDAQIEAAARDAAVTPFLAQLPEGLNTRVGPGGQRLSGGQRQRVALARALLRDPRILLLDEATSALDAESEAAIQAALNRVRKGRTTVIVAHRLATAQGADRIVAVSGGRAVEQGDHASLMACDGLYARLVRHQVLMA